MSTLTEHRADSIEHLEHESECDSYLHDSGVRPPAEQWLQCHGCVDNLLCRPCEAEERRIIESALQAGRSVTCNYCGKRFWSYEDCYPQVVPL